MTSRTMTSQNPDTLPTIYRANKLILDSFVKFTKAYAVKSGLEDLPNTVKRTIYSTFRQQADISLAASLMGKDVLSFDYGCIISLLKEKTTEKEIQENRYRWFISNLFKDLYSTPYEIANRFIDFSEDDEIAKWTPNERHREYSFFLDFCQVWEENIKLNFSKITSFLKEHYKARGREKYFTIAAKNLYGFLYRVGFSSTNIKLIMYINAVDGCFTDEQGERHCLDEIEHETEYDYGSSWFPVPFSFGENHTLEKCGLIREEFGYQIKFKDLNFQI